MSYARNTAVPIERSKAEIERTLARYGANQFAYFSSAEEAAIAFQVDGRNVRMRLPLPALSEFASTPQGKRRRTSDAQIKERDQEIKRRWRALVLVVKSKLEAIETGIATFDDEFLAYLVTASGRTVGEELLGMDRPGASR